MSEIRGKYNKNLLLKKNSTEKSEIEKLAKENEQFEKEFQEKKILFINLGNKDVDETKC